MNGEHWGIMDAAAVVAELERTLEARRRAYPDMVAKGRLTERERDYRVGIMVEIGEDLRTAFGPPPWHLTASCFGWRQKVNELAREVEQRRAHNPDRIAKGRISQADADRQRVLMESIHDLYWRQMLGWKPPIGATGPAFDIRHPNYATAGGRAYRQAVRDHQAEVAREAEPEAELFGVAAE